MRILIADDHELVRRGVRSVLLSRADFEICGEAVDGQDAVEQSRQLYPDLIVMDISMPRLNGLEATRQIRQILPQVDVLVLSQHDSPEMMRQAVNAGARGYVVKSAISENLIDGIDTMRRGQLFFDAAVSQSMDKNLDSQEILQRSEAFERALRESEERFRLTFEQAAVGIAHVAPDGRWLRVNQKLCDIVGYTQEELRKLTFQDITHPTDLAEDIARTEKMIAGELDHYSMEKRYIRKDGSVAWINLTVGAVRDAEHSVKYFVSVIEDIRARKGAQERLRESEEQLRELAEFQAAATSNMAEGLYTLDERGLLTSVNPAAEAMLGWTAAELLGKKMHDVTHYKHPDGSPFPASECPGLRVLQEGARLREHEDVFIRKDGSFMPVVFSASPLRRNGKVTGVVVGFRDDSESRRARSALRESELRLRAMIDALPAAIYTTDADGLLTHFNPAAVEFSGRVPALGSDHWCVTWKLFAADGSPLPHEECPMAIALREGRVVDGLEVIAERPDGTRRWFTPYPRPLRDGEGKIIGGVNMLVDITERKQAEQVKGLLAAIVGCSDDAIVSKNLDGLITSWNKGAERLFGHTAEEAVGQNIKLIIPPDRDQEEASILAQLRRGERVDHFETVRVRKDGTFLDISLSISPIKNAEGHIVGASKVARDITERKRASKSLAEVARQQKALFHFADQLQRAASVEDVYGAALDAIFAALPCDSAAVLLCDERGAMRFASWRGLSESYRKAVEGHSVWKRDETNPQPICMSDVDAAEMTDSLRQAMKAEGIHAVAFIPLISNRKLIGKFMAHFNAPHAFGDAEIELSLTVARQLAFSIERKVAEEALRQSEERFRALAESLEAQVRARTAELEMRSAEVVEQSEQLRDLSGRLLQAQDDERRRIARELHDSAGQILTVLGLNLGTVAKHAPDVSPHAAKAIEDSRHLVTELSQEIRTMSYLLHPPLLDESGLADALRWYVQGLSERSSLDIELQIPADFERLSSETELVIFRVVQEALTNVHRHSRSKTAAIRLAQDDEIVSVEIQDWGEGIPAEKLAQIQSHGSGVGIRGIRERVRQLQGEMKIHSNASGTRITVTFPVSGCTRLHEMERVRTYCTREESHGGERIESGLANSDR